MPVLLARLLVAVAVALAAAHARASDTPVAAPSFAALYQAAIQSNPALRGRVFGVARARAEEDGARSRLLPQLSAVGNYSWNDYYDRTAGEQSYKGKRGALQARQALIDLAGYFRLQGAKLGVQRSELDVEAARMGLAGEVLDRYLLLLDAAAEINQLQAEMEVSDSQRRRLRAMRERQLVRITDVYEVEAYYEGLLTKEIEARNQEAIARERLRETTGVAVAALPPLERSDFEPPAGREDEWVSEAVRRNPNLTALAHGIDAAREMIAGARAEHAPQLFLTLSKTYSEQGYDNRSQPPYRVGTIGVQLNIPLYEGGRVDAAINDAVARHEMAREQHEQARRQIEREARTAYRSALASLARISSTRREAEALEKAADAQEKSYQRGLTTIVDLLATRQRLVKARTAQAKARHDFLRDYTALHIHAGRFDADTLRKVNDWLRERPPDPSGLATSHTSRHGEATTLCLSRNRSASFSGASRSRASGRWPLTFSLLETARRV